MREPITARTANKPRHTDHEANLRRTAEQLDENVKISRNLLRRFAGDLERCRPETVRNFCGVLLDMEAAIDEHHIQGLHGGETYSNAVKRSLKIEHTPN